MDVDTYMRKHEKWRPLLERVRCIAQKHDLEETLKWGAPVYTHNGKNVLGLGAFKNHAAIWFFQGALLNDPHGLLINAQEGKTRGLRQIRFRKLDEVSEDILKNYISEAIQLVESGNTIPRKRQGKIEIPKLLKTVLAEKPDLKYKFESLSPFKQKEFCEYISEARQDKTKQKRLQKVIPLIADGVGLNDKYRSK